MTRSRTEYQRQWKLNNPDKVAANKLRKKLKRQTPESKKAYAEDVKLRRRQRRLKAISALGGCCLHCGFSDERALQFDHKTPVRRKKSGTYNHGGTLSSTEYKAILESLEHDIQLLCANCHQIKTAQDRERGWLGEETTYSR